MNVDTRLLELANSFDVYLVGGYLRDQFLGLSPNDRDFAVVGATPEDMLTRGFSQVGKSFPVFLNPETKEEYALARVERKTGPGYTGFSVEYDKSVTIYDDLLRRDLTMNAIAQNVKTAEWVDPFNGRGDLGKKLLKHVGTAFAEDPLRVLRLARFAAKFPTFDIAFDTIMLARSLAKELDFLSHERILLELTKGLVLPERIRMFEALEIMNAYSSERVSWYANIGSKKVLTQADWISDVDVLTAVMIPELRYHPADKIKAPQVPTQVISIAKGAQQINALTLEISSEKLLEVIEQQKLLHAPSRARFEQSQQAALVYIMAGNPDLLEVRKMRLAVVINLLVNAVEMINALDLTDALNAEPKKEIGPRIKALKLDVIETLLKTRIQQWTDA